jgi:hypothetical protein
MVQAGLLQMSLPGWLALICLTAVANGAGKFDFCFVASACSSSALMVSFVHAHGRAHAACGSGFGMLRTQKRDF